MNFQDQAEQIFQNIEDALDLLDVGIESLRQGPVLELEFDDDSKIVVNSQAALQEIWVAGKAGGFHFKSKAGLWLDTRSGEELFATLSRLASAQSGQALILKQR